MSHLTHMKTHFQNLFYLEKALNGLNIIHNKKTVENSDLSNISLIIPQSNSYDIKFIWNEEEYELVADMNFWEQPSGVENFINKIRKQYAEEVIIGESNKLRFQPINDYSNVDGSKTLVLERWNS